MLENGKKCSPKKKNAQNWKKMLQTEKKCSKLEINAPN
jgi:hypothetical protein